MKSKKLSIASKIDQEHQNINREIGEIKLAAMKEVSPEDFSNCGLSFSGNYAISRTALLDHLIWKKRVGS